MMPNCHDLPLWHLCSGSASDLRSQSHGHWTSVFLLCSSHKTYRIYSCISWQFLAQIWRSSCGYRLIRESCHTATVDSQHDGYLSATLTVCEPHTAWTISRSLELRGCVGESKSAGFWMTTHRHVLHCQPLWLPTETSASPANFWRPTPNETSTKWWRKTTFCKLLWPPKQRIISLTSGGQFHWQHVHNNIRPVTLTHSWE